MPPWLFALLQKSGSTGMVDSLSQLVGTQPGFVQLAQVNPKVRGTTAGDLTANDQGQMQIGLTPYALQHFNSPMRSAYGETGNHLPVSLGESVIQHEFGHIAAHSPLLPAFEKIDPDAENSEQFADRFQNAVQFLRSGKTDTSILKDASTQQLVDVLLQQPLYLGHPINTNRALVEHLKNKKP